MAYIRAGFSCCGLAEISGIQRYSTRVNPGAVIIQDIFRRGNYDSEFSYYGDDGSEEFTGPAFAIFTEAYRRVPSNKSETVGAKLADYIIENGLGDVTSTDFNTNPNSGNKVRTFVWTVNQRVLRRHLRKLYA